MKTKYLYSFLIVFLLSFYSCKKNNVEKDAAGNAIVKGAISLYISVMHHSWGVGGITVYMRQGSAASPVNDTTKYNWKTVADAGGNVKFENLFPGNYYVYARGLDHTFGMPVLGYNTDPYVVNSSTVANNEIYFTLYVSE